MAIPEASKYSGKLAKEKIVPWVYREIGCYGVLRILKWREMVSLGIDSSHVVTTVTAPCQPIWVSHER